MVKSRVFRVSNGRFHFKCHACRARRMISVSPTVRQRTIHCYRCKELTRCMLNRRFVKRGQQLGRVILLTQRDERLEVNLFDISLHGVGFDLALKDTAKLNIGDEVRFICPWSPNLLRQGRYKLRSQHGCRVGAEQTQKLHY